MSVVFFLLASCQPFRVVSSLCVLAAFDRRSVSFAFLVFSCSVVMPSSLVPFNLCNVFLKINKIFLLFQKKSLELQLRKI